MAKPTLAQQRIYAWLIDLLLFLGLGAFFGGLGWIASTGYWLLRDGLFEGQSVGKRLMGLKVVVGTAHARCTFVASAVRNLLWVIPLINLAMGLTGLYALSHERAGRHWGDRLADTRVLRAA
ncbi:MAG: RDD family protein [Candidatus Omnitrophica bacterium]|nr:RDD family protein [Candidatus Omnitrophota bacterium]